MFKIIFFNLRIKYAAGLLLFLFFLLLNTNCRNAKSKTVLEEIEEAGRNAKYIPENGFQSKSGTNIIFPEALGYVNDFGNMLTHEEKKELDSLIRQHEKNTTDQIAIATFDTVNILKTEFDDFTLQLANSWGIGQKDKNNGVLIAICSKMHRLRIHTGKGIEKRFTNAAAKLVVDSVMIPEIKTGNYFIALKKGLNEINAALKQQP